MGNAIEFSVDMSSFLRAIEAMPVETMAGARRALKEGCQLLVDEARKEYNPAKRTHTKEGHRVEKSIQQRIGGEGMSGTVFLNKDDCPWVNYLHEGTEYHRVEPKDKKALHWVGGGESFFSKGHMVKGIKPDQFLYRAAEKNSDKVVKLVESGVVAGIKAAGF